MTERLKSNRNRVFQLRTWISLWTGVFPAAAHCPGAVPRASALSPPRQLASLWALHSLAGH